jgi:hypothetical protein
MVRWVVDVQWRVACDYNVFVVLSWQCSIWIDHRLQGAVSARVGRAPQHCDSVVVLESTAPALLLRSPAVSRVAQGAADSDHVGVGRVAGIGTALHYHLVTKADWFPNNNHNHNNHEHEQQQSVTQRPDTFCFMPHHTSHITHHTPDKIHCCCIVEVAAAVVVIVKHGI